MCLFVCFNKSIVGHYQYVENNYLPLDPLAAICMFSIVFHHLCFFISYHQYVEGNYLSLAFLAEMCFVFNCFSSSVNFFYFLPEYSFTFTMLLLTVFISSFFFVIILCKIFWGYFHKYHQQFWKISAEKCKI